jgi:tetratricopeptide (TPR) repeat protein
MRLSKSQLLRKLSAHLDWGLEMRPATLAWIAAISVLTFAATSGAQTRDENWAHCKAQDPNLAIEGCTALIQSGAETPANLATALANRGNAFRGKKEYEKAIRDYSQAVKLNPDDETIAHDRVTAFKAMKEEARAGHNHGGPMGSKPGANTVAAERCYAYQRKRLYPRAIPLCDEVIKHNANDAYAFYSRGEAFAHTKKSDSAIRDFDQAIKLNPGFAEAFNSRGYAHLEMKRYDAAIADFDKALKLAPKMAFAFYGRGLAEKAKGETGKANSDFATAKSIFPSVSSAVAFDLSQR